MSQICAPMIQVGDLIQRSEDGDSQPVFSSMLSTIDEMPAMVEQGYDYSPQNEVFLVLGKVIPSWGERRSSSIQNVKFLVLGKDGPGLLWLYSHEPMSLITDPSETNER